MKNITADLIKEFQFRMSRSGGSGGQHVNKVSSRVEVFWNVQQSVFFDDEEKLTIVAKLANRINKEGFLQLTEDGDRSQFKNKQHVIERLLLLLSSSLVKEKPRKATRPKKSAIAKRLDSKKKQALKKINRNFKGDW